MSSPNRRRENSLSPQQQAQIERIIEQRQRLEDEWIYLEESPLFNEHEQPTPIPDRAGPGSCGDAGCPYAHGLFAPHETAAARDKASAARRDEQGLIRRYHVNIWIKDSWMVDARSIRALLSVSALEAQEPTALSALRVLRHANTSLVYISEAATGGHARLLIFSEDFGVGTQIAEAHVVSHPSRTSGGIGGSHTNYWRSAAMRRLRAVSLRAKIGTLIFEALLVYGCGELAAWLLGDGNRLASDHVTLPVWLVAIPLILLGTAVKWLAWRRLRPIVQLTLRRIATLRARTTNRMSGWIADLDEEGLRRAHEQSVPPLRPWQQPVQAPQRQNRLAPAQPVKT
jgi:hypothetical protein